MTAAWLAGCAPAPTPAPPPPPPALDTQVAIAQGEIRGERLEGEGTVHVFRGVPYAAPPLGELRWRPPEPHPPWAGVRPALEFGHECWQARISPGFYSSVNRNTSESEDCLTLNVWTPAATALDRLPVMVWIHGGGLMTGTGSHELYDSAALARRGVVVVTFNYRLNAFGFLAHPALSAESEHRSSSHYGLLDQIAVLRWVKENIAAFGGDPGQVTIFGESAGSLSVHLLLTTPLARGLFHRAIGQSGAAFNVLHPLRGESGRLMPSEKIGERFAEALGVSGESDVLAAMRARPAEDLVAAFASDPLFMTYPALPPVDGWVLPDQPRRMAQRGEQADVPVIMGSTAEEGAVFVEEYLSAELSSTMAGYEGYVRATFGDSATSLLEHYPAADDRAAKAALALLFGDDLFVFPTRSWARSREKLSSPAYLYQFSFRPKIAGAENYGAFHASDLPYVFDTRWPGAEWREEDAKMSDAVASAWVRFAKTGNPNGGDLPEWPAYTRKNEAYLDFGETIGVSSHLRVEALAALDAHYQAAAELEP